MTDRIWILGAADPEMEAIESLLRECGEHVAYAVDARGERVRGGEAYRAHVALSEVPSAIYLVECHVDVDAAIDDIGGTDRVIDVRRIDHHRPGDPGYGRPPSEFLPASSIGQVIAELARLSCPENYGRPAGEPEPYLIDWLRRWGTRADFEPHTLGARYGVVLSARRCPGEYYAGPYGLAPIPELLPADHTSAVHDGSYWVVSYGRGWLHIPMVILLTAAADHCLAAAYRGECPGVDPDALMRWRVETRAAFQGRPSADILADVERARKALRNAPVVALGHIKCREHYGCANPAYHVADMRNAYTVSTVLTVPFTKGATVDSAGVGDSTVVEFGPRAEGAWDEGGHHTVVRRGVAELPEAAAREGVAYLATVTERDGRQKVVLGGHTTPETVRAFMNEWAPAEGIMDIYGDPARGFAGGYLPQHDEEDMK